MAIDPTTTTTVKVSELASAGYNTTDLIPHEVAGILKKGNLQDLATFIGGIISTEGAVGFRAVTVTDGQTLPATTEEEFILVGPGTYPNVGGGSAVTTTEPLNALVSNGTYWFIGVEIPISASGAWGSIAGEIENQADLMDALDLKADLVDGKVPSSQLPSYVDDVVEVANYAALPATGETGKIYITIDTNKVYRWSGSAYIEIAADKATWGLIEGTLSNQNDLQNALNAKFNNPTGNTTQYIAGDGSLITFPTAGQAGTLVREVRNTTGSTLTKGTIVYISGATGNKPTVSKAIATGDSTSAQTFGMVQADISNNANGYVVCIGDITGLNTSAITEGTQLYLSSTTAGTYTTTKQLAPAHLVYIGVVTRSHATLGQIEVKIQNGYELDELHDVAISSKTNKDFLVYESSTDLWKNKSLGTIVGGTSSQFIKGDGSLDSTAYLSGTVAIANGGTGATTASAARTNLGGTTIGSGLFTLPNAGLVSFLRVNADNTVELLGADLFRTSIGAGTGNGSVTSVSGTGSYGGLTLTGTVTGSGDLTLGGTPTGTWPISISGNAASVNTVQVSTNADFYLTFADGNNGSPTSEFLYTIGSVKVNPSTGALTAGSFVKSGGTSSQYLMADGSVSTGSGGTVTGTGTTNYLPKFTGVSAIGNSNITDNGTVVAIITDATINGVNIGRGGGAIASNTRVGLTALNVNTSGNFNTAIGYNSLRQNTTGGSNSAFGAEALDSLVSGNGNSIFGTSAGFNIASSSNNTFIGRNAGRFAGAGTTAMTSINNSIYIGYQTRGLNAIGSTNEIVIGYDVVGLGSNTTLIGNSSTTATAIYGDLLLGGTTDNGTDKLQVTGSASISADSTINGVNIGRGGGAIASNTRVGLNALAANTTGSSNAAIGWRASQSNTTGSSNTSLGTQALQNNTTGSQNTNIGVASGLENTIGNSNTNIGNLALTNNTTGSSNIALGNGAGRFIANGTTANTISNTSIFIGATTKALADNQTNQIVIGHNATGLGSNTTVLGNSSTTTTAIYGNLGIGTTSPTHLLSVENSSSYETASFKSSSVPYQIIGNAAVGDYWRGFFTGQNIVTNATTGKPSVKVSGYTASAIAYSADSSQGYLGFFTTSSTTANTDLSERMRITSGGNVGIGTTSPAEKLSVSGGNISLGAGYKLQYSSTAYITPENNVSGAEIATGGILTIKTGGTTERVRVDASGNVGIGTTSPTRPLHVIGGDGGTGTHIAQFEGRSGVVGMYIRGDGNVGIGTTSPSAKLQVYSGASVTDYITFNVGDGSNTLSYIPYVATGDYNSLSYGGGSLLFNTAGSRLTIGTQNGTAIQFGPTNTLISGNVGIGNTSPSTKLDVTGAITASGGFFNSDMRLKDLTDYDYNVSDIKPITYLWKDGRDNKKHVGYSAQEVQKVMPDAVNEGTDGMLSVNYVEVLVAKIAELENRIKQLEK